MAHSMWPLIYLADLAEILSVLSRPSHRLNRVYEGGDHMIQPDLTEAFIMYMLYMRICTCVCVQLQVEIPTEGIAQKGDVSLDPASPYLNVNPVEE